MSDRSYEPLGDALGRLGRDLADLVRAEFALFKREALASLRPLVAAGVLGVAGAIMAVALLGAITALLVIALAQVVALWIAALIVTALYAVVTATLLALAAAKLKAALPLDFERTTRSVKEDVAWIKSSLNSGK